MPTIDWGIRSRENHSPEGTQRTTGEIKNELVTSGDNLVRPHHFVVFVFEDVAVPDVAELVAGLGDRSRGKIELCDDARDVVRRRS